MNEQITIEYAGHRCLDCGTYWAIERTRDYSSVTCPRCAGEEINQANERAEAAVRSKNSLRGAVTRKLKG